LIVGRPGIRLFDYRDDIAGIDNSEIINLETHENARCVRSNLAELFHNFDESDCLSRNDSVAFINVWLFVRPRLSIKNSGKWGNNFHEIQLSFCD